MGPLVEGPPHDLGRNGAPPDLHLDRIARRHGRNDLDIKPELYEAWLDSLIATARELYERLESDRRIETWGPPRTGINVFRPVDGDVDGLLSVLPAGVLSTCHLDDHPWLRSVAANPLANPAEILAAIDAALGGRKTRP